MLRVMLTRPLTQSLQLAKKLHHLGIDTVIFPTIEIVQSSDQESLRKLTSDLSIYDSIIFISPAAVQSMHTWLNKIPKHIQLMAVGKDTAQLITQLGLGSAIFPKDNFNRAALLDLPELQTIMDKNILLCRGADGNLELGDALRKRGALVFEAIAYQRRIPSPSRQADLSTIDIIQCTSGESLRNLLHLVGPAVLSKKLLLSSKRLSDLAKSLGFTEQALLAKNAGDEAILHTLLDLIG